jgi:anti-sigma-K factor RskA
MSDDLAPPGEPGEFGPDEERDLLAAEYILRLLEGEELLRARGLAAGDAQFQAAVDAWERRLAPLAADVAEVSPPPELWARIERAIGAEARPARKGGPARRRRTMSSPSSAASGCGGAWRES